MHRRGSPARRLVWLVPLAAVLVLGLVPAASGGHLDRRVADTWFQTIRFPDGGSARIVVSTKPVEPSPGEGIDLGTVVAAGGSARSDVQLAPVDAAPVVSPAARLGTNAAGGSGSRTAYGWVNYTSYAGIELWRWIHQISWSYASYRVTAVYGQYAGSLNSCCLWDYQGLVSQSHGPPGGANFTAFAQGKYRQCLTSILCQSKSPWVWLQGNGNGILTGFSWGVG